MPEEALNKTIKCLVSGVVLLAGLLVFTSYRACRIYDENSILKGKDEILTIQLKDETAKRKIRERDIKMLLAKLDEERAERTVIINTAVNATKVMQSGLRTVGELEANAENDKALIFELKTEIGKRDELITKLVFTIKTQEERYFGLTKQYNVVLKELGLADLFIKDQKDIILLKDTRIKGLEKSLKGIRFSSDVKTGVAVALAVAVIYGLVK